MLRILIEKGEQIVVGAVDAEISRVQMTTETVAASAHAASAAGRRRGQFRWIQIGK